MDKTEKIEEIKNETRLDKIERHLTAREARVEELLEYMKKNDDYTLKHGVEIQDLERQILSLKSEKKKRVEAMSKLSVLCSKKL
jgi:hypothetical protein